MMIELDAVPVMRERWTSRFLSISRSPFFGMPVWILAATALYLLGWSDLLTPIRLDTVLFLTVVGLGFFLLAQSSSRSEPFRGVLPLNPWAVAAITIYFAAAVVKNGGVPVFQILSGAEYDVYGFGINGLHIAMLCFSGYYGVRAFRLFLEDKRIGDLAVFVWILILLGVIGNRSAVSFLFVACVIVYLRLRRLSALWTLILVLIGLVFVYIFGVFGDVRLAHQIEAATGRPAAQDAVVRFARASSGFEASGVSPSWLWSYTYFTTPLANLNHAFGYAEGQICSRTCDVSAVIIHDAIPDVLGNRIGSILGVAKFDKSGFLVAPDVTAATLFGSSVAAAGVVGALIVTVVMAVVGAISLWLLRGTRVYVEGCALLGTVVFFAFFENMVAYTPLIGQLVVAVACAIVERCVDRTARRPIAKLWTWAVDP